jgi:hypothetical protein
MRRTPFQLPRIAPYFWTASIMYWLQLGVNRQLAPSMGPMKSW